MKHQKVVHQTLKGVPYLGLLPQMAEEFQELEVRNLEEVFHMEAMLM
jgi:hypothetical protein